MKKRILACLLMLSILLSFSACGVSSKEEIGSRIKMGTYGDFNGGDLRWRVISVKDGEMLVISEEIIEWMYFDDQGGDIWEYSTIRQWLNEDFYYNSFNAVEREIIISSDVENPRGNVTKDRVFLLSTYEIKDYLGENKWLESGLGHYAVESAKKYCGDHYFAPLQEEEWWTRSQGRTAGTIACVSPWKDEYEYNDIYAGFPPVDTDGYKGSGVRPAMWIKIDTAVFTVY